MSNTISVTKHIYLWKYAIQDMANGQEVNPTDICVRDTADNGTDSIFYICPVEISVDIPSAEQGHLMQLAGMEAAYEKYKADTLDTLKNMEAAIQEMQCLTHQESAA